MYMAPPFLAYYGAATSNATLLEIAYNQAKQYRTILQGGKIKVWQHIVDGA
jgi:rhamnogalacturonyl hydrolase YesR